MNILICPDKFKGSLKADEVCRAVASGIRAIYPDATIHQIPLADGGEGTCELLTDWHGGRRVNVNVHGPLFDSITAGYGIFGDETTAFVEMAEASGLTLLRPEDRNPLFTTSFGTGEIIADALNRGVQSIVLGIGGSATNDAGIGMASALGYVFLDSDGAVLKPTGENLIHIHRLQTDGVHPRLTRVKVTALCDVSNPLHGPDGAAAVYAGQKGADKSAIGFLDAGLKNFRRIIHKQLKVSVDFPGAGAAGGLGAGAKVFLHASIQKGINYIIESTGLMEKMYQADLVITGEGKIDRQTFSGKVVSEIARRANKANKPVIAICGLCEVSEDDVHAFGIQKVIALVDGTTSTESAIRNAGHWITKKVTDQLSDLRLN